MVTRKISLLITMVLFAYSQNSYCQVLENKFTGIWVLAAEPQNRTSRFIYQDGTEKDARGMMTPRDRLQGWNITKDGACYGVFTNETETSVAFESPSRKRSDFSRVWGDLMCSVEIKGTTQITITSDFPGIGSRACQMKLRLQLLPQNTSALSGTYEFDCKTSSSTGANGIGRGTVSYEITK